MVVLILGWAGAAFAQEPAKVPAKTAWEMRPQQFFREEWKDPGDKAKPLTQEFVANPNLELKLYGTTSQLIEINHENGPVHSWNGMCSTPCAVAFKHKTSAVDLSGLGRIQWMIKVSGMHQVRPIVKLGDGTWLVGDRPEGSTVDWHLSDFSTADLRWLKLDIDRVVTLGTWISNPDLSKVDEVGYVDLIPGSGHGIGGFVNIASFEVFGRPVTR